MYLVIPLEDPAPPQGANLIPDSFDFIKQFTGVSIPQREWSILGLNLQTFENLTQYNRF